MKILILLARVSIGFVLTIHCRRIPVLFRDGCVKSHKFILAKSFKRKI